MPVYLPPWLDVSPRDFVNAAAAGGRLGAQIAGLGTEANIAAGRNTTALQEAQMRENTALSGQQAEGELARARLEEAARQHQAEQMLRQWEVTQQIKRSQDTVAAQNERAANAITAQNQRAADALSERQSYGNSMLDIRREANRIAQERADAAANKPSSGDFATVTQHTKEVPDTKRFTISEPEIHNLFSANTPAKTLVTTNVADLANIPKGSVIATNTIPGTGTPAMTISRRVPAGQDPYALTASPAPAQTNPLEGKRVRDKQTGKIGTITNGEFVPDEP